MNVCFEPVNPGNSKQEVVGPFYRTLPVRQRDPLFNTRANKGQDGQMHQETAVTEKAQAVWVCFSRFIATMERRH